MTVIGGMFLAVDLLPFVLLYLREEHIAVDLRMNPREVNAIGDRLLHKHCTFRRKTGVCFLEHLRTTNDEDFLIRTHKFLKGFRQ